MIEPTGRAIKTVVNARFLPNMEQQVAEEEKAERLAKRVRSPLGGGATARAASHHDGCNE